MFSVKKASLPCLPTHVAIIMDGNRRWARKRFLPSIEGHRQGAKALQTAIELFHKRGVHHLTVFAFSAENSNRSTQEVSQLMSLICKTLMQDSAEIHSKGICLKFIGRRDNLDQKVLNQVISIEDLTAGNSDFHLTVALNYGGQQDIMGAAKTFAINVKNGKHAPSDLTPDLFSSYLSSANMPPIDIVVRTSGEQRISNFLLWELAYAEFMFMDQYWPDFNEQSIDDILQSFQNRNRRFGQ